MNPKENIEWFKKATSVIDEPLKFKAQLAIGEDAYLSLRAKNKLFEAWDTLGVASTAAAFAQSSVVASTFFAPTGILAAIGIGTASTPIGWVIAAGLVSSGAWSIVKRFISKHSNNLVQTIPKFINTPMDILALGLFNFFAPLALKVAIVDGEIDNSEITLIRSYFIKKWGYNKDFVKDGLTVIRNEINNYKIKEVAYDLAEFQKSNPDCNYKEISKEIIKFLTDVIEADGVIDEREEMAIESIERIFKDAEQLNIKRIIANFLKKLKKISNIKKLIKKQQSSSVNS